MHNALHCPSPRGGVIDNKRLVFNKQLKRKVRTAEKGNLHVMITKKNHSAAPKTATSDMTRTPPAAGVTPLKAAADLLAVGAAVVPLIGDPLTPPTAVGVPLLPEMTAGAPGVLALPLDPGGVCWPFVWGARVVFPDALAAVRYWSKVFCALALTEKTIPCWQCPVCAHMNHKGVASVTANLH